MFEVSMLSSSSRAPAGAAEAPVETPWVGQRRALRPTDGALTDATRTWLHRLPLRRRPLRLVAQFPRVANRIALCWGETGLAGQVLDDLLVDHRGGRRGFPPLVARELQRLRDYRCA